MPNCRLGLHAGSLLIFPLQRSLCGKSGDFVRLLEEHGSPPKVLWLTCGNTSDAALQQILERHLSTALNLFSQGENLVEIGAP